MDEQIDRIGRPPVSFAHSSFSKISTGANRCRPNVMRGFLGPEVFEGGVTIVRKPRAAVEQLRLVSD